MPDVAHRARSARKYSWGAISWYHPHYCIALWKSYQEIPTGLTALGMTVSFNLTTSTSPGEGLRATARVAPTDARIDCLTRMKICRIL